MAQGIQLALWLVCTCGVYALMLHLYHRTNSAPWLHPVVTSSGIIIGLLLISETSYTSYRSYTWILSEGLELATVAIAVPLYRERKRLAAVWRPFVLALGAATIINLGVAFLVGWSLKLNDVSLMSLMTKSVTTPVALGISDLIGGNSSLVAVIVISTGIIGAMLGPWLLSRWRIDDPVAMGLALGTLSHGVGTARAFQMSPTAGAFAGLSMAICAILTSLILPSLIAALW
jgi:putative effector of murein hydrolase